MNYFIGETMKRLLSSLAVFCISSLALAQNTSDIGFETKITGNIYNSSCALSKLAYQPIPGAAFDKHKMNVKVGHLNFDFDCNKEQAFKAYPEISENTSNKYRVFFKDEISGKVINAKSKLSFDEDSTQRSLAVFVEFTEEFTGNFDELVTLVIELD